MSQKSNSSSPTPKRTTSSQPKGQKSRSRYYAKKKRVAAAKAVAATRGPEKAYFSVCCSLPARKPPCGQTEAAKVNDDGKKIKVDPKGLGHWRCSGCGKSCKVTVRKPEVFVIATTSEVATTYTTVAGNAIGTVAVHGEMLSA